MIHVMKLHPLEQVLKEAGKWVQGGHIVYQQFNCAKCNAKQTMDKPNAFFEVGICEECGHATDIVKDGCNYMLQATLKEGKRQ
jgi:hypothetical protein